MLSRICFILLLCWSASISAQEISLLTCGSGDEVYSTFGHSAIRVNDDNRGTDIVYNYGTFDFNTPGFLLKFMRGKLPYRLSAGTFDRFMYAYEYEKRSVVEQKLELDPTDKAEFLKLLRINMMPANREYAYDFFFDNCSTRILDLLKASVDTLDYGAAAENITYRQMLKPNLINMPWSDFGIDLIIGAKADKLANRDQQMFLPAYLSSYLSQAKDNKGYSYLGPTEILLDYAEQDELRNQSPWITPELIFGLLALILLFVRVKFVKNNIPKWINRLDNLFLCLIGICGIIMMIMWWATDHQACANNWNLLWASPLIVLPALFKISNQPWMKYVIYGLMALLILSLINVWFQFLPMYFHPAFGWIILILLMILRTKLGWHKAKVSDHA